MVAVRKAFLSLNQNSAPAVRVAEAVSARVRDLGQAFASIEDVQPADVVDATGALPEKYFTIGRQALASGEAAVVTLAAGIGSPVNIHPCNKRST